MRLYRARGVRGGITAFDPLDESGSVGGTLGWRFNDTRTPILYTCEVEALAVLEVAVRPGWETLEQVLIAEIELPDGSVASLDELGITLPSNWNSRPAAADSRSIAREFLNAATSRSTSASRPLGVRVPSILSSSDHNVLLDPAFKSSYTARIIHRMPFKTYVQTKS